MNDTNKNTEEELLKEIEEQMIESKEETYLYKLLMEGDF